MEIVQHFSGFDVRFEMTDNGIITHGSDLARCLYFANPSQAVVDNVWAEYRFKHRNGVGAPSWYLTEPGVWQLIFSANHQLAVKIQRWVFEEVLPAIRVKGGYISPDASLAQIKALQDELNQVKERSKALSQTNYYLENKVNKQSSRHSARLSEVDKLIKQLNKAESDLAIAKSEIAHLKRYK